MQGGGDPQVADPIGPPEPEQDDDARPGRDVAGTRPRWMFALGIIVAVALVGLMVLLHLSGTIGPDAH